MNILPYGTAIAAFCSRCVKSWPIFRCRRFCVVLGLCLMVMPAAGFWVDPIHGGRDISAIRMRVALEEQHPDVFVPATVRYRPALNSTALALDRGRYRATLRDISRERLDVEALESLRANPSQSMLSVTEGRVALAFGDDASMTLNNVGRVSPSKTFLYWLGKGTAIPQDVRVAQTRQAAANALADLTWLVDADLPMAGECAVIDEVYLAADIHRLVLALRTPDEIKPPPVRSGTYIEHIRREAKRFGLPPQLVFGIMRAESAFNPYAVSNAGALGLMQLVPDTAGNEVHRFLTGKSSAPSRTMFFDPVKNIEYGSAYLHLLATRYFSGVSNRSSRELCMIAAYNAGPGAVMRVFNTSSREEAVAAINATTPTQLFNRLSRQMPAEETRLYIGKVLASINAYPG